MDSARICTEMQNGAHERTIGREEKNHIDLEPYTPRRRRLRINKDLPSLAFSRMGEYFKHPASLRFLPPPLTPLLIRTFIISARETFFIDCPAPPSSDTACKLSSLLPYNLSQPFSTSNHPLLLFLRRSFFPSRHVARVWIHKGKVYTREWRSRIRLAKLKC